MQNLDHINMELNDKKNKSHMKYEVIVNGEIITQTDNETSALVAYATSMQEALTSEDDEKVTVELLDHEKGEFVSVSRQSGKIADRVAPC